MFNLTSHYSCVNKLLIFLLSELQKNKRELQKQRRRLLLLRKRNKWQNRKLPRWRKSLHLALEENVKVCSYINKVKYNSILTYFFYIYNYLTYFFKISFMIKEMKDSRIIYSSILYLSIIYFISIFCSIALICKKQFALNFYDINTCFTV